MSIYREKDSIKNILEYLKHFSLRSHHKLFLDHTVYFQFAKHFEIQGNADKKDYNTKFPVPFSLLFSFHGLYDKNLKFLNFNAVVKC